jgi:hypothetical protein
MINAKAQRFAKQNPPVSLYSGQTKGICMPVAPPTMEFVPESVVKITQGMADKSCIHHRLLRLRTSLVWLR